MPGVSVLAIPKSLVITRQLDCVCHLSNSIILELRFVLCIVNESLSPIYPPSMERINLPVT